MPSDLDLDLLSRLGRDPVSEFIEASACPLPKQRALCDLRIRSPEFGYVLQSEIEKVRGSWISTINARNWARGCRKYHRQLRPDLLKTAQGSAQPVTHDALHPTDPFSLE